jgi:hypothetical protein
MVIKIVIIRGFSNPENPGIEPQNPRIGLALKSSGISGLDSLYKEDILYR